MNAITYTSIHQMTALLIEVASGRLNNQFVEDSLQGFLYDLSQNISTNEARTVRESIETYVEDTGTTSSEQKELIVKLKQTATRLLGNETKTLNSFFEDLT